MKLEGYVDGEIADHWEPDWQPLVDLAPA
ncbi:MAG: hypothetical protein QOJ12_2450, partial [Thermoleophilales bacterium]|nr:hypothetical protein [Thermoleophilales bacterium]